MNGGGKTITKIAEQKKECQVESGKVYTCRPGKPRGSYRDPNGRPKICLFSNLWWNMGSYCVKLERRYWCCDSRQTGVRVCQSVFCVMLTIVASLQLPSNALHPCSNQLGVDVLTWVSPRWEGSSQAQVDCLAAARSRAQQPTQPKACHAPGLPTLARSAGTWCEGRSARRVGGRVLSGRIRARILHVTRR
jgi:hypothetical protein